MNSKFRGVKCVQEPKNVFGARLAQYLDPDGLAISVGASGWPPTLPYASK